MTATTLTTLAQRTGPVHDMFFRGSAAWDKGVATDSLFMWVFWFSTFWFVLLMGLMVWWVYKYRRRPGVPAPRSVSHNAPLEVVWTVVPSLFLGYIFFRGFHAYIDKLVPPADSIEIVVKGMKWNWTATYPNGAISPETTHLGASNVPVIVLPAGRAIRFKMYSDDVIHSFWIPDFRMKFDVMPNRYTSFWIQPMQPGETHWVFCAEYCGDQHSEMAAVIRVVTEAEYNDLVGQWGMVGGTPQEMGERAARKHGCFACHSIDGTRNVGPTWRNAYGNPVPLADGSSIPGDDRTAWDNYIRESILVPGAKLHAGYPNQMNSFQGIITEDEILWITAYIRSLSDHPLGAAALEAEQAANPEGDAPANGQGANGGPN
ncbi:MAG: cytochrome c oxidase subunit 2 [Phycisphaerales bacterium]|nr:cytochrome c oxidase subunit II [Phycisphaerales bacterium]GIK19332.1 MAG: cytochrome c oxidase subunit 2 [Planctomycetota bacterium]